ncbi:MAG: hypothetical protein ACK5ZO_11025 [Gemmatimonas sp.]|uniref:hypothetical protein n=2 Tax=Gemmatimonas sp. TaxID=1962908 RepID=UPI00391F7176
MTTVPPHVRAPADLIREWRRQAAQYERDGMIPASRLLVRVADELELVERTIGTHLVTLNEAARLSGYAPDTLGRMIRDGRLTNYGRKNAPKVRVTDLPLRVGTGRVASPARHRPSVAGEGPSHDTNDQNTAT